MDYGAVMASVFNKKDLEQIEAFLILLATYFAAFAASIAAS
jgi:hypothetical protein